MTQRQPARSLRSRALQRGWLAVGICAALGTASMTARATDLAATLPHVLFRGPPAGPAAMPGGDWSRANRSGSLGDAAALAIVWRRRVSSGVGCNLLVDPQGRLFVAGSGQVTELGFDGRVAYQKAAEFSECLAAALLADGSRVVLGSNGQLSAWSPRGARRFDVALDAPVRFTHSSLLPLPDGGVLASLGARIFDVGPEGELRAHTQLGHDVVESLVIGERVTLVDALGEISEWNGRAPPRRRGSFGTSVVTVAASDTTTLIGLASRAALAFSFELDEPRALFAFDRTGVLPLISVPVPGRPVFLRADGSVDLGQSGARAAPPPGSGSGLEPLRDALLVASDDGVVVWVAANVPLEIVAEGQPARALPDVVCSQPASLISALGGHLVLACKTGQLWLLGPVARAAAPAIRPD